MDPAANRRPESPSAAAAAREIALALGTGVDEVGSWSLAYLGPGFHVQLRIARRERGSRIEGFMSPVRPVTVVLSSVGRDPVGRETAPNLSGRFEFRDPPTGPCRLAFVGSESDRPYVTPPFWV